MDGTDDQGRAEYAVPIEFRGDGSRAAIPTSRRAWRGVRPVRQREDRHQGDVGQVHGGHGASSGSVGAALNPLAASATTANRSWNDARTATRARLRPAEPARERECGAMSDLRLRHRRLQLDARPRHTTGAGASAPTTGSSGRNLQHELIQRVSINVGYFRRWFGNFIVTDNLAVGPQDFDQFSVTAPVDPRLPNGGGQTHHRAVST